MERARKYIKTFAVVGGLAGLLYGLAMALKIGLWNGILAGVIFGAIGGSLMALVLIPLDLFFTRKFPPEALNVQQHRELKVQGECKQVFEKCHAVLESLPFIKAVSSTNGSTQLSANTKMSFASFGEDIKLTIKELDKVAVEIHISSRPAFRYTLLDYGKNFRNVEQISAAINNHC